MSSDGRRATYPSDGPAMSDSASLRADLVTTGVPLGLSLCSVEGSKERAEQGGSRNGVVFTTPLAGQPYVWESPLGA
jgi:hypothetical protein